MNTLRIVLLLLLICTACASQQHAPVLVDGLLGLEQTREQFKEIVGELGYQESEPSMELKDGETLFRKVGQTSEGTPFLRVKFDRENRIETLSGRPTTLVLGEETLVVSHSTVEEIRSLLGEPTWEKHVGNGTIGLCYKSRRLYLSTLDGKLKGFSLGKVPTKPNSGN